MRDYQSSFKNIQVHPNTALNLVRVAISTSALNACSGAVACMYSIRGHECFIFRMYD